MGAIHSMHTHAHERWQTWLPESSTRQLVALPRGRFSTISQLVYGLRRAESTARQLADDSRWRAWSASALVGASNRELSPVNQLAGGFCRTGSRAKQLVDDFRVMGACNQGV